MLKINLKELEKAIFIIENEEQFSEIALRVFQYQASKNPVYKKYIELLNIEPSTVQSIDQIPFLPIEFYKSHKIICDGLSAEKTFGSSGTGGQQKSFHFVHSVQLYEESCLKGFERAYGKIEDYCVLALLPSYLERNDASLVHMAQLFINKSKDPDSGFFLANYSAINKVFDQRKKKKEKRKTLLLGVSFALLELAEQNLNLSPNTIVMETGGMKGRKKEMIREELHQKLCEGLGVQQIHSEYGMTELLSQAYAKENGLFECPPWMKVLIRDPQDPLSILPMNKSGGINVIDLANIYSCSFLATEDLGRVHKNEKFEVLGRFDNAAIRGCNLLMLDV